MRLALLKVIKRQQRTELSDDDEHSSRSDDADEIPSTFEHRYCKETSRISDSGKLNSSRA